jgi:hypothetical protein
MFNSNDNITIRKKIENRFDKLKTFERAKYVEQLFIGKELNKNMIYEKMDNSLSLVFLEKNLDKKLNIARQKRFYYQEGNILKSCDFAYNIADSSWYKKFINNINISDQDKKIKILDAVELYTQKGTDFIEYTDKDFLRDDKNNMYFYTSNGVVHITKDGANLIDTDSVYLDSWIAKQIGTNRKIKYNPNLKVEDWKEVDFFKKCTDHFDLLQRYIGYLCHTHKDNNTFVCFIDGFDVKLDEDDNDGGGTGKTLVSYLLKIVRNVLEIPQPDTKDKFWLGNIVPGETQILLLNEVKQDFKVEDIRTFYEMSVKVEQKHEKVITLEHHMVPRILMNTNFAILKNNNADDRRVVAMPFTNYWKDEYITDTKKTNKVEDTFGHRFFASEQTDEWWSYCLNFIIDCSIKYLSNPKLQTAVSKEMLSNKKHIETKAFDKDGHLMAQIYDNFVKNKSINIVEEIANIEKDLRLRTGLTSKKVAEYVKQEFNNEYGETHMLQQKIKSSKRFWVMTPKGIDNLIGFTI